MDGNSIYLQGKILSADAHAGHCFSGARGSTLVSPEFPSPEDENWTSAGRGETETG